MPVVSIAPLQGQPDDFVQRIGVVVYRTSVEQLTQEPWIRGKNGSVRLEKDKKEN